MWTWTSVPLHLDDKSPASVYGTNASGVHQILAQSGGAQLIGTTWIGSLATVGVDTTSLFNLRSLIPLTISFTGTLPSNATYTLNSGWTWIGIPMLGDELSVDAFLAGTWSSGDRILTQNGGTQYFGDSVGWLGSITVLTRGVGCKVFKGISLTATHLI